MDIESGIAGEIVLGLQGERDCGGYLREYGRAPICNGQTPNID